jgi:hypothetical protein
VFASASIAIERVAIWRARKTRGIEFKGCDGAEETPLVFVVADHHRRIGLRLSRDGANRATLAAVASKPDPRRFQDSISYWLRA